jgi:hypothetical protein
MLWMIGEVSKAAVGGGLERAGEAAIVERPDRGSSTCM